MLLEALIIPLKMDSSGFDAGASSAAGKADSLVAKLTRMGGKAVLAGIGAVSGAVTAVAAGINKAIAATVKWGDDLDALQDVTDLTNDQVAGLNFLLRKHGVDAGTAARSLTFLNKSLLEANGNLGTSGRALQNWGIDIKDANGELKSNADLMQEVANKYASLGEGAERTGFATDVFGKSGAELNDVLLEMADGGFQKFIEKAQSLGLNLNADDIQKYKQAVEETKLSWEAIQIFLGSRLLPTFQSITEWLTQRLQDPAIKGAIDTVVGWFDGGFAGFADSVGKAIQSIDWKEVSQVLISGIDSIDWAAIGNGLIKGAGFAVKEIGRFLFEFDWWGLGNSLASAFNNLWAGMFGLTEAEAQKIIKSTLNGIARDIERWVNNVQAYLRGLGFQLSPGQFQMPKFDMSHPRTGGTGGSTSIATNSGPAVQAGNYTYKNGVYTLNRASGGPVIAGQTYNVAEFFQPERFTPTASGRVDPIRNGQQEVVARIDEEKLVRLFISAMQQGAVSS